jgi:uncharacterized membrane protein
MSARIDERRLEKRLAGLLWRGTLASCAIIGLGLLLMLLPHAPRTTQLGSLLMNGGIALLLLLPIVRVALMLAVFVRERELRFAGAATVVLLIIAISLAVGLWTRT